MRSNGDTFKNKKFSSGKKLLFEWKTPENMLYLIYAVTESKGVSIYDSRIDL